jgi:hypothetical protein
MDEGQEKRSITFGRSDERNFGLQQLEKVLVVRKNVNMVKLLLLPREEKKKRRKEKRKKVKTKSQ